MRNIILYCTFTKYKIIAHYKYTHYCVFTNFFCAFLYKITLLIYNIMEINALKLKEYRKKHNITQLELAELLGVSFRTVQNYEAGGKIPQSKHEMLRRILHHYEKEITGINEEDIVYLKKSNSNPLTTIIDNDRATAITTWEEMLNDINQIIANTEKEPNSTSKITRLKEAYLTKLELEADLLFLKR